MHRLCGCDLFNEHCETGELQSSSHVKQRAEFVGNNAYDRIDKFWATKRVLMEKKSIGVAHSAYGYCIWKARNLIIHQGRLGKKNCENLCCDRM